MSIAHRRLSRSRRHALRLLVRLVIRRLQLPGRRSHHRTVFHYPAVQPVQAACVLLPWRSCCRYRTS